MKGNVYCRTLEVFDVMSGSSILVFIIYSVILFFLQIVITVRKIMNLSLVQSKENMITGGGTVEAVVWVQGQRYVVLA